MLEALALAPVPGIVAIADERSLFHIPSVEDVRQQRIARTDNEHDWPFAVDEAYLSCVYVMGEPTVYMTWLPDGATDADEARTVVVSTDPLDLMIVNIGSNDLFAPFADAGELIRRLAPFESLGHRLCEQPRGSSIGPGEL